MIGFGLVWVIYNLDPFAKQSNLVIFYTLSFLLVYCGSFLSGLWLRRSFGNREFLNMHLATSARQALWMGLTAAIGLWMTSLGIFTPVNSMILIGMFIFLEAFFLYQNR